MILPPLTERVIRAAKRAIHGDYQGTQDERAVKMAADLALLGGAVALLATQRKAAA